MNSTPPAPADFRWLHRRLLAADSQEIAAALAQALHWLVEGQDGQGQEGQGHEGENHQGFHPLAALPPQAGPGRGAPVIRP